MKCRTVNAVLTLLILGFQAVFLATPIYTVTATDVSGVISEDITWTMADSPYIITDDVIVKENAALTIQPGVEVKFDGNHSLTVYGSLHAEGTSSNKILFTSNKPEPNPGDWSTLRFAGTSGESFLLRHCLIEFATYGVTVESRQRAVVENSEITNNLNSGIHIFGQCDFLASENVIKFNSNGITGSGDRISGIAVFNNSILCNNKYGVNLETEGSIINPRAPLTNVAILSNNISFNEYGIYLFSHSKQGGEVGSYILNVTVSRNTIYSNDQGIYFKTFAFYDTSIHNVRVSHNSVFFNKYGIHFDAGGNWHRFAYENTVSHNVVALNGIGMYLNAHHYDLVLFDMTVANNIFSSNNLAISIGGSAKVNVTQNSLCYNVYGSRFDLSKGNLAKHNDIYRNIFYGMYVTENATVNAEYNYWGDINGPSHDLNPEGKGDRVNGQGTDLDYIPFLQDAVGSINESPLAEFEVDRRKVAVNQTIAFDASSSTDDEQVYRYFFDFGDGSNSSWITSSLIMHAYSSPGNYTAFLAVIDNLGAINRNYATLDVTVSVGPPPLVMSIYSNSTPLVFPGYVISVTIFITDGDYPVPGATVMLISNVSGTFSPSTGVTDANGYFDTVFVPPSVATQTRCTIVANATEIDYADAQGQIELLLMPPPKENGGLDQGLLAFVVFVAIVVVIALVVKMRARKK